MKYELASRQPETVNPPAPLPALPDRLPRGIYNNFAFEFTNAIMWQSFGSPVILFIRQSGASAFVIGALSAIPLLLMPLTLAGSGWVERVGYRRVALSSWTLRWLFSGLLILIALADWPGFDLWRVPLSVGVVFLFHLMRNFGISANVPWQTAIIPASRRGLFLSRTTLFANLGSVGTFLAVGLLPGNNPTLGQFAQVFGLGVVGGLLSSVFMSRIQPPIRQPARPRPKQTRRGAGMWSCFARPGFLSFVVVQTFFGIAFYPNNSLGLIYLREQVHIPASTILYFSTAGVVGATIAAIFWGNWIDRRGTNSLQLIGFLGLSLNLLLWFVTGLFGWEWANVALAALACFLGAVWTSALTISQSHAIMMLAPDEDRVMFQNMATFMMMISQALAPMLWGILLDVLSRQNFGLNLAGLTLNPYRFFYLVTLLTGLVGAGFLWRLGRNNPARATE